MEKQQNPHLSPNANILVIEDDPGVSYIITQILKLAGYNLTVCDTGSEALALLEQGAAIDLITLDMQLLDMTGQDFLLNLRALPVNAPPIVIISGSSDTTFLGEQERSQVCSILFKPFTMQELKTSVQACIGSRISHCSHKYCSSVHGLVPNHLSS